MHPVLSVGVHCRMRLSLTIPCLLSSVHVRMDEAMNELAPGNHIEMRKSKEGSGRGAAIVAAVASRLRENK